ncbi:hypothetical protein BN1723_010682 [Verticillium longisporum]|uniref:Thiol-specific monooxygenase n=1 Tax=Verticillium longisporum TaxID=100787 RepID=A0A0G4L0B6_VERLO|nr:hypothetical protein BN1723_010682 [Verticillium longisporum]
MSFTREPFPDKLSERTLAKFGPRAPFRHREVVREWVQEIFVRNGNDKLLELNTTVERAVKNEQQEWVLTLRTETPGKDYWWEERFDALIAASGHYNVPWIPDIPGLVDYDVKFPGKIQHSKHFRGPESFAGMRVVIVGGSISSHEVLHEILPEAKKPVYAALRGDPVPAFGWAPFTHPHIVVKNEITRFDPETGTLFFADGSHLNDVDHVIFGTGYTFSLPFLPDVQAKIKQANRRLPGVFQHTFSIDDPSLAFIGMLEWEQKRVAELKGGKNYYSIALDYEGFFEYLRYIAGDPTPGTTGRVLPPFDKASLAIWTGMVATKIKGFEEDARKAELEIRSQQEQETHQRLQEIIGNWSPRAKL